MTIPEFFAPADIPDGEYEGTMSGHHLMCRYKGKDVFVETDLGVRGINVPHRFRIVDGRVDEESITPIK